MGFDAVEFNNKTTQPLEDQFWDQFDGLYDLTEDGLRENIPLLITDPNNRAAVDALVASAKQEQLE